MSSDSNANNDSEPWNRPTKITLRADVVVRNQNEVEINQYRLSEDKNVYLIFAGNVSKVNLCQSSIDKKYYAVKKWSIQQLERQEKMADINKEIDICCSLSHPNIVKMVELIRDPKWNTIFMITEYCEKKQVMDWDENKKMFKTKTGHTLEPDFAKRVFRDVVNGVAYLHSLKIVHRDLKPLNILIDENNVAKIVDFGEAEQLTELDTDGRKPRAMISGEKGTVHFIAPEVYADNVSKYDGFAVDVWALGICLFCFLTGRLPFKVSDAEKFKENLKKSPIKYPRRIRGYATNRGATIKKISALLCLPVADESLEVLKSILTRVPEDRPSCDELLTNPYIANLAA